MKILVINWQDWTNPFAGGAEVHLREVFTRIQKKGHKVTLLCSNYKGAKRKEILDGIEIIRVGKRNTFNFSLYRKIKRFLERREFDVIVDDLNKIPFYTPLFTKKPVVGLVHHLFREKIFKETSLLLGFYVWFTESLIPKIYKKNFFIAVSPSTKEDLVRMGISTKKIIVGEPGVDFSVFKPARKKKKSWIVYVGRIKKYKSIQHLLYAADILRRKHYKFKVFIGGEGDYLSALKKLVKKLKLDEFVEFLGYVPIDQLVELYQQAICVVQPSIKEGWGLSIVEAGACKTTVIASDVPGLRNSVIHKKTGFLYSYGAVEELAELLETLLTNKKLATKLAENNYRWAQKFSWERTAKITLDVLKYAVEKSI